MLEILKWLGLVIFSIYTIVALAAWIVFWYCDVFVDGVFTEGWESFKLAFSWPYWATMTIWHLRKNYLMRNSGK